jgi:hypothetical protein
MVNRPMETVKLATPTGISEKGQQEKAQGSWSQFCSVLCVSDQITHPATCRRKPLHKAVVTWH